MSPKDVSVQKTDTGIWTKIQGLLRDKGVKLDKVTKSSTVTSVRGFGIKISHETQTTEVYIADEDCNERD